MANTSARMLRLLSLLETHRHWPGAELAARLEVSARTLRRDIDRLRDLGYPVQAHRGETPSRHVEPHQLVSLGRRWYLAAYDLRRDDWRTFRLDRVEAARATGVHFAPRELPGGDAVAFVRASIGNLMASQPAVEAGVAAP